MARAAASIVFLQLSLCSALRRRKESQPLSAESVPHGNVPLPEQLTARGYPVTFDGLPTATITDYRFDTKARWLPTADGSAGSRVFFFDVIQGRGLDDRMYQLVQWLSLATSAGAALAFPSPQSTLTAGHGACTAEWWTDYYVTDPPVYRFDEVRCDPAAEEINITNFDDYNAWPAKAREALRNQSVPLCIRLQLGEDAKGSGKVTGITERWIREGAKFVAVWTSDKVANIIQEVLEKNDDLSSGQYNAAHVRLGDKLSRLNGTLCRNASNVVNAMERVTGRNAIYASNPWILMSDGEDDFFDDMATTAAEHGFTLLSEKNMQGVNNLTDNYLRYTALSCLWAESDLAVATYKSLGKRCGLNSKIGRAHV